MLYRIDKCLAAVVVGMNFFMIGIGESSLYTILPKYLVNHSNQLNVTVNITGVSNFSIECNHNKPPYVIVSMILLAKNLAQLLVNIIVGSIADKTNYYLMLIISHGLGIIMSIIYAFNNIVSFYIVGRVLDAIVSSVVFVSTFGIIAQLFSNSKMRARYFGLANILFFVSHSIGPVYGAGIDEKFNKMAVFLLLIPLWFICSIVTMVLYWKIKKNRGIERKSTKIQKVENVKKDIDEVELDGALEIDARIENGKLSPKYEMKLTNFFPYLKMLKDPYILSCLLQVFTINLSIFCLASTLPSWMALNLCSTEIQQGIVWTFGFCGYGFGVGLVVLVAKYLPQIQLIVPIFGHLSIGLLLIWLPFTKDWRLIFIPILGMYLSIGVVEQVIFPITTLLADCRFQSNYGAVSALTSLSLTISGIVGTLFSGQIADYFGFITLSLSVGIVNLILSPMSLIHFKMKQ